MSLESRFTEHWAGHDLNDNCPFTDPRRREPRPWHYGRAYEHAKSVLVEFLTKPGTSPIRTFSEGSVFDAEQFGEDSVLKIYGESFRQPILRLPKPLQKPDYEQWNYWGVVTGFDHQDQRHLLIAAFKPGKYPGTYTPWEILDPAVRVGEVSHRKDRVGLPFFKDFQMLEKPERLEVWGMGRMQRRSVTVTADQKAPGLVWSPGQARI